MARVQRLTYFKTRVEDKPGALLAIMKELKARNIGLSGLWAYGTPSGRADVFVIPRNPDKLRETWKGLAILSEEGTGFFLRGPDKTGVLLKSLEALAMEGVNLVALSAVAIAGNYGSLVWVKPEDTERVAKILGIP